MEVRKYRSAARRKFLYSNFIVVLIVLSFVTGIVIGYLFWHDNKATGTEQVLVKRVIDGDTIELADGNRVRYLGIDTPESGGHYFQEATEKNREMVEGKSIELQSGMRDKDEYGRLLRYVYTDDTFVNAELVAQGFAKAYIFDPNDPYSQILVQLEQYAKMKGVGLWAGNTTNNISN